MVGNGRSFFYKFYFKRLVFSFLWYILGYFFSNKINRCSINGSSSGGGINNSRSDCKDINTWNKVEYFFY